jgi:proteic killer suppression protein
MIVSFGSKETEKIWKGEKAKRIPVEIQKAGRRKLRMLNSSQNLSRISGI